MFLYLLAVMGGVVIAWFWLIPITRLISGEKVGKIAADCFLPLRWVRNEIRWRRRPLLYVCKSNGVIGVVRARDYHRALRFVWRSSEAAELRGARPLISPTFRFFNTTPGNLGNTGGMENYNTLVKRCRVLPGDFVVTESWSEAKWTPGLPLAYSMIFGKRRGRKLYEKLVGCMSNC